METRKAQRLGPSTLALTLPASWTADHGIEKGDELLIQQGKGTLTVTGGPAGSPESEAIIQIDDLEHRAVERAIIAQYVLGRRVIHVKPTTKSLPGDIIDAIYRAETQLMGLGVIEETPDRISIRCSVNPDDFTLKDLIRRLERAGRTMRDEAVKALVRGNPDLAKQAYNRERQANKIFVLLLRLIYTAHQYSPHARSVGLVDTLPLIGYCSVAKNLELTADNAEDIAKIALDTDGDPLDEDRQIAREIREFTAQVNEITALAVESVIGRDFLLTTEVRQRFHDLGDRETQLLAELPELPNETLLRIREVLVSLREMVQYAMRNAEIAANLALREDSAYVTVR